MSLLTTHIDYIVKTKMVKRTLWSKSWRYKTMLSPSIIWQQQYYTQPFKN